MKSIQKLSLRAITFLAVSCLITMVSAKTAFAGGGWDYKASHGMKACEFETSQSAPATVNLKIEQASAGTITITAEIGHQLDLDLYCARDQTFDKGQLATLGNEVSYSSDTLGGGTAIGVDKPEDYIGTDRRRPKGRRWTVPTGNAPATYVLNGGSDKLTITVQPVAGPVSHEELAPVADKANQAADRANEAYDMASYGYQNRIFQINGSYILHLDSVGKDKDARGQRPSASQGVGLDLNVFLGGKSKVKFLTGLTFDWMSRQKKVAYAPNLPDNGFNGFVDWSTFYIGPKAGIDYMPVDWFQLQAWGSLGALVSVDGTIPISQLPDRTLYSGESVTKAALGYKAALNINFIIAKHLVLGPAIGLEGNATPLPVERGPERICSATDGSCLVLRQGHFVNAIGQWTLGGMF